MERSLKELCEILGVSPSASSQDVKQAYRDLVQFWHPDKHADKIPRLRQLAEEKMKEINDAYEHLKGGVPREVPQNEENKSTARSEGSHTNPTGHAQWVPPYQPVSQPAETPNSGFAVAATAVAFLLCVFVFSEFTFVKKETRMTEPSGWFSSAKYETVSVTSWLSVTFWTVVVCGVIYSLVLWKRGEALTWLLIIALFWMKMDPSGILRLLGFI